ncbi:MAG: ATP-binding cassette domain-containing protein [Oscillospiraceae bacterium]|nr:ATP-binding cassette domain-containing protein [Oscillospiraceae bacterium]
MTLFTLKNINYLDILQYPDLAIPADKTTFLCGESGTGKSTLLRLCNGTLTPTSGEVAYSGKPIETYNPCLLRREVLLVGQSVYLFDLSIADNFKEYYTYRDLPAPDAETMRVYLDICAAPFALDSMCNTLSGGERQRVFLAIHLSLRPKVLLLDEPSSALDEKTAETLIGNVKAYCASERISLVIVSHDKGLAAMYADDIIILGGAEA